MLICNAASSTRADQFGALLDNLCSRRRKPDCANDERKQRVKNQIPGLPGRGHAWSIAEKAIHNVTPCSQHCAAIFPVSQKRAGFQSAEHQTPATLWQPASAAIPAASWRGPSAVAGGVCYAALFMDEIVKHLLDTAGTTAIQKAIGEVLTAMAPGSKKVLSRKDKQAIQKTAERMIQAATIEDVHRYNPLVRKLEAFSGSSVHRKAAPAKRAAKKVIVKKVAREVVVTRKRAPAKRSASKH